MLNEIKTYKYTQNCIKDCPFIFIARPTDPRNGNIRLVMIEISEEEEILLNKQIGLSLNRGGLLFNINPDNCLCYGECDLSPNSKDLEDLCSGHWYKRLNIRHFMPANYDYATHTGHSDNKTGQWFDSEIPRTYLPYLYACLNKPKRICIFTEYLSISALRRKKYAAKQKEWVDKNKDRIRNNHNKKRDTKRTEKLKQLVFAIK